MPVLKCLISDQCLSFLEIQRMSELKSDIFVRTLSGKKYQPLEASVVDNLVAVDVPTDIVTIQERFLILRNTCRMRSWN